MRAFTGSALLLLIVGAPAYLVWRITRGVEFWFATSGAGDVLMWALVAALALAVFAIPVALWGVAARMWVVRLDEGQYLESTPHALAAPARPRARPQLRIDAEGEPARAQLPAQGQGAHRG